MADAGPLVQLLHFTDGKVEAQSWGVWSGIYYKGQGRAGCWRQRAGVKARSSGDGSQARGGERATSSWCF